MAKKNFYITTTLPYVNADPHIGFALEIVQADAIARHRRLLGDNVFFNFGTDEHGLKIYRKALENKKTPQEYVNEYAKKFDNLKKTLNLTYNSFIRTTETHHIKAAQEIWTRCFENGFIEKGIYKAKYCVGCELEKQDSELVEGKCAIHPNLEIEIIDEENYFFKFSKFEKKLLDLYKKYPDFIVPANRLKEITNFVSSRLEDFSVSRLKEKMPWGVPVPNDDKHVMFVWFDALTNYISALDWPDDEKKFKDFWGTKDNPNALQMAGKDNLRQQAAMWQAMLLAADLPTSRQIFIHGFVTSGGQKMSKSLGNVINPFEYVEKYGTDAVRYFLLAKLHPFEDSDFTKEKFETAYNADLANGVGNLVSRVTKLLETLNVDLPAQVKKQDRLLKEIQPFIESYNFYLAFQQIWQKISQLDRFLNDERPWETPKSEAIESMGKLLTGTHAMASISEIAYALQPFLPETSEKILRQFAADHIKSGPPLFPRI
ncbi:methionine--tRNA ligase [Patescibacteria group bacterium]|nr:methionine--tRNA ligase [Patescibacteria group bacterium]